MFLSFITGHFRNLFYFTIIILVHELGHFLTAKLLGFKVDKIEIYPYGGCSKLIYDINERFVKELLVLIMGPVFQISFMGIVYYLKLDVPSYFYTYSVFILGFNLLPIYPLDGGRLLHLISSLFLSYYYSLRLIIYISYFMFISILIYLLLFNWNLLYVLIILLVGKEILKEIKQVDYYFHKFLLERYLNNYVFSRTKIVRSMKKMNRYCNHIFNKGGKVTNEKVMLNSFFKENRQL